MPEEDAEKIAIYLKRDLNDAASYSSGPEHELEDWLEFETTLLESSVLDLLLKTADETTVKLLQIKEDAQ